jgi:hypothetical protein
MTKGWVLALIAAFGLAGCAGLRQFPEVTNDHEAALVELDKDYAVAVEQVYGRKDAPNTTIDGAKAKAVRNRMIETRMAVTDAYFKDFQAGLVKENVRADFLLSVVGIGVGGAGALVSETASQILSAVSAGLAGTQAAYGKAVLYDKAMSALVAQMQASRKAVAAEIFDRWNDDIDRYPMWMARKHLEAYYFAGSLPGAILATAADAKVKDAEAEDRLARFRRVVFREDASALAIRRFIWPPEGNTANPPNNENLEKVRTWLQTRSSVPDLPIATWLSSGELQPERERAIRELQIPTR